jgi:DNA-binding NarL/FixJ family response regulator
MIIEANMAGATILIYENNVVLRQSIVNLLSLNDQYSIVGQHDHPGSVVDHVTKTNPGLILMDIDMPGMSGIEGVRKVRAAGFEVPILMLTVFDDNSNVFEAIRAGASGYLLKKHIPSKLFDAIVDALSGGAPMSPSVARMVISSMRQDRPNDNPYNLTPREKEVLLSLSKGNSYKMMAAEHTISIETVRGHIKKIYEKLQVHSQTEAVSKAINEKLV